MAKVYKFVVGVMAGALISTVLVLAKAAPGITSTGVASGEEPLPVAQVEEVRPAIPLPLPSSEDQRNRTPLLPSRDPADQIAPPGLIVRPGDEPIPPYMAIAMRQELDNLVGRFESALLMADAANQPAEVRLPGVDTALKSPQATATAPAVSHPVLVEARQLIQDWSGLIEDRAYREARDRWLTVRQQLWRHFPLDRPFAQPEIRAMWLDRGSIVRAGSPQGLARLFDKLQSAGINTVFLETINASYPIYPSRIAPQPNPLTRRWDPLTTAIELAHARHIELHAWMWVFAAGNQRHNAILNLPTDYLGPVLNLYPDWANYDNEGNPIPRGQTKPFFDPANPQVRDYLLSLVDEIITHYDVDGLQLDYIRYPFQDPGANRTYGYGRAARQQFHRLTGVDPIDLTPRVDPWLPADQRQRQRSLWERWTEFRIQQVTSFVAQTSELVRQKRPDIVLSAAVFALPEHERLQKIQQDWNRWARDGLVDWIVLMSYAQDTNRFTKLIEPWILQQDYSPTLVIPGIRLLSLSVPAMMDQVMALRDLPAPGYALFATDNLNEDLQTVLNNTQGPHPQWVPQQRPYQTAAERFRALQREWNWLLGQGQMGLEPKLAEDWIGTVNQLGQALTRLANGDTTITVETVRSQVDTLKQDMGVGMRIETATSRDYRLSAWANRLEAISRFLTYGAAQDS